MGLGDIFVFIFLDWFLYVEAISYLQKLSAGIYYYLEQQVGMMSMAVLNLNNMREI